MHSQTSAKKNVFYLRMALLSFTLLSSTKLWLEFVDHVIPLNCIFLLKYASYSIAWCVSCVKKLFNYFVRLYINILCNEFCIIICVFPIFTQTQHEFCSDVKTTVCFDVSYPIYALSLWAVRLLFPAFWSILLTKCLLSVRPITIFFVITKNVNESSLQS